VDFQEIMLIVQDLEILQIVFTFLLLILAVMVFKLIGKSKDFQKQLDEIRAERVKIEATLDMLDETIKKAETTTI
jgi:hypothetical protein